MLLPRLQEAALPQQCVAGRGKAVQGEDAPSTSRLANAAPSALEGETR